MSAEICNFYEYIMNNIQCICLIIERGGKENMLLFSDMS